MCERVELECNRTTDQTSPKKESKKARIKELEERVSELETHNSDLKGLQDKAEIAVTTGDAWIKLAKARGEEIEVLKAKLKYTITMLNNSVTRFENRNDELGHENEILKTENEQLKTVARDIEAANEKWRKEYKALLDRVYDSEVEARKLRGQLKECCDCSTQDSTNLRIAQLESTVNLWVDGYDDLLCWSEFLRSELQEDEADRNKDIEELKSENEGLIAKLETKRHLYIGSLERESIKFEKRISALKQTIKELAKED